MTIIEEINDRLTVDEMLTFLPELTKQGHNYVGRCPTGHDSKSGTSFSLNTIEPTFHCFNCGETGSYIHLIELIKFGNNSAGSGGTETFKQTLTFLSERFGLQTETGYSQKESVFDIIEFAVSIYQGWMEQENPYDKLELKYGLTKDFLIQEKWGYGKECPSSQMLEFWSKDDLLSTGLFYKSDKSHTGLFHIYQGRIIIPYNISGRVRYTIGRSTAKTRPWGNGKEAPKYLKQQIKTPEKDFVSDYVQNQIVKCSRDKEEVLITEGITDYLVAKMHNINAVSAVTTSFKKKEYSSVVDFCKQFKKVYIANDNDENGAGQKGARKICEMLIEAGIHPYVVILPRDSGQDKVDFAEYVRDNGINAFLKLKESAPKFIDILLEEIPPDVDKESLLDHLSTPTLKGTKSVKEILSRIPRATAEIIVKEKIRDRFNLTGMNNVLKSIIDEVGLVQEELKVQGTGDIFNDNADDIKVVSSGQDFTDGVMYYTFTRPTIATDKQGVMKVVNKPFLIDSNKNITEIKDYQIIDDNFSLNRKLGPQYQCEEWSFNKGIYSIERHVSGKAPVNPSDVFLRIKEFIRRYMYFKDENDLTFSAVILMASPVFMVFHAIGYIHLWAEKRSGKTTLLEIFEMLGFNARLASSISDAALYRTVEAFRPMLLIDEAEHLNPTAKQRENGLSEKLELLKSGYKKSGAATRSEGKDNTVITFHNYCLKIFAGTKNADPILADRMIVIEMMRAAEGVKIQELIEAKVKEEAQEIKDMLYCYGLEYSSELEQIYLNGLDKYKDDLEKHKVTFRQKELWTPYLCIALLIDKYSVGEPSVFEALLDKAQKSVETKEKFDGDAKGLQIIEEFYLWSKQVQEKKVESMALKHDGDIYTKSGIRDHFIKDVLGNDENKDDFGYMTMPAFIMLLRKFHIIDKDSEIPRHHIGNKYVASLCISQEQMLKSMKIYKNSHHEDVLADFEKFNLIKEGDSIQTDDGYNFDDKGID